MQKVMVINFEEDIKIPDFEQFMKNLVSYVSTQHKDMQVETFDTPLEAFAAQEGPFRIGQLAENGYMGQLEDKAVLKEMEDGAASDICSNVMGDDSSYGSILDNDILEQIAIDNALSVLKGRLEKLNVHDREIAEYFIATWDDDSQ